ncbi:MAG: hypothetical protein ACK55I_48505 [bacterium]
MLRGPGEPEAEGAGVMREPVSLGGFGRCGGLRFRRRSGGGVGSSRCGLRFRRRGRGLGRCRLRLGRGGHHVRGCGRAARRRDRRGALRRRATE